MSAEEIRALWARHLGGEELSAAEQAGLVAALEADPALRDELLEDVQLDGALRALGDARRDGAAFVAQVAGCLAPERDATRFIRKVEARLAEPPPEPSGSRDSRTGLPRVSRRFQRRSDPAGAGWKAALVAAGVLFAILLFSAVLSGKRAPRDLGKAVPLPPGQGLSRGGPESPEPPPVPRPEPPARDVAVPKRAPRLPEVPEKKDPEPLIVPPLRPPGSVAGGEEKKEAPAPSPAPSTVAAPDGAVARGPKVVSNNGHAYFDKDQTRPKVGAHLNFDQEIYTNPGGLIILEYDDRTLVKVGEDSRFRDRSGERGRRLYLAYGQIVEAEIRKQPAGRPMVFETPQAEATILGTRIRLSASRDPQVGTTLEVEEGKVAFSRIGGAPVDVGAGRTATAAANLEPRARVTFPKEGITIRFGPADMPRSPGYLPDSGDLFTPERGYGWDGANDGKPVGGEKQPDGRQVVAGRTAAWRDTPKYPRTHLQSSSIVAGWGAHAETWTIELPNGSYLVTVGVGDATYEQGPHHVAVEGEQLLDQVLTPATTAANAFVTATRRIEVRDGVLEMKVGGYPGPAKSPADGSKDTILNFLSIKRVPAK